MNLLSSVEPWDIVAEGYATVTSDLLRPFSEAALDRVAVRPGDRVADIACGPGSLSQLAAARGATVDAVDFSPAMIAQLERRIAASGLERIRAQLGDGQALPFDDAVFDAAFSMFGLMFFPDRAQGFAEMLRTLKPGGLACVSSWAPTVESPLVFTMLKAFQQVNPSLPDPVYDIESLENPDVLKTDMIQAGFREVEVHAVQVQSEFASAQTLWADMARGSAPIAMARRGVPDAAWDAKATLAVGYIDRAAGPFPAALGLKAFLGVGRK